MPEKHARKPADRIVHPRRPHTWKVSLAESALPAVRDIHGSPPLRLAYGFAGIILVGTLLLMLPISSISGRFTNPIDALFTSTSAVCITGLVVVDTGTYWSPFGLAVLLALFQIGGLGFMISATLLLLVAGRRIGLRERMALSESMGVERLGGMVKIVRRVALFTGIVEALGTAVLFARFVQQGIAPGRALWMGVFHAVSAFNNCGMDLFGGFRSLLGYQSDAVILLTMAVLIILGGIGYVVVDDILRNRRLSRLTADSRMVLMVTGILLVTGTVFILLFEAGNPGTMEPLPWAQKITASFFQAVTPRTAGFAVIDMSKMAMASLFFTMFLMFVGAASGSTGGGVKVNTFGIIIAAAVSTIRRRDYLGAFGREFSPLNLNRALTLVTLYIGVLFAVVMVLLATEHFPFVNLLFEVTSALGTVGLTTGITPDLSVAGRLVIILTMFIGRLGPLTLTSALIQPRHVSSLHYPKATVRIG